MRSKEDNPWNYLRISDYLAHMDHPNVGQVEVLNRMLGSQMGLLPAKERENATVAVLGVTDGNGLEHAGQLGYRRIIGIDINQEFLEACKQNHSNLGERLEVYRMDLVSERTAAVQLLQHADLILADLLIEHIHLDNLILLLAALTKRKRYFSCAIQWNPDKETVSKSGFEQAFSDVASCLNDINREDVIREMTRIHYRLIESEECMLVNGKKLIRMDFEQTVPCADLQ